MPEGSLFCPFCGKKFAEQDQPISLRKEIFIYLFDIVLTPLGLIYFFKYFRNSDPIKKRVAYASLIITIVTLVSTVVITANYVKKIQTYYINSPALQQYKNLGL